MKNTLVDLNNHLFAQLERLSDEEIKGYELKEEIERSKAVMSISKSIVDNGALALDVHKFMDDRMDANVKLPPMLEG